MSFQLTRWIVTLGVDSVADVGAMSLADLSFHFCYHTLCNLSTVHCSLYRSPDDLLECRMEELTTCNCSIRLYVLVLMNCTTATALDGLEPGIRPVAPLTRTFVMTTANGKPTSISRQQLPITPAYAFSDYGTQVQAIEYCVVNIGKPPNGRSTPFNA